MKKNMAMHYLITRGDVPMVFACALFSLFAACAMAAQYPLISDHTSVPMEIEEKIKAKEGVYGAARRVVKVELSNRISGENRLAAREELLLNLFDDAQYQAVIEKISKNVQETVSIRGRLVSFPAGYVMISTSSGRNMVQIRIPEKNLEYLILYDPETQAHYLLDIDPSKKDVLPEGPALRPVDGGR